MFEFRWIFDGEVLEFDTETGGKDVDVGDTEVGSEDVGNTVLEAASNHVFDLGGCEEGGNGNGEKKETDGDHDSFEERFHGLKLTSP